MPARVIAVHAKPIHAFSKATVPTITLVAGHGVDGDAHFGVTVKHRSRVARDPTQPNLRQVHLIHQELFDELHEGGLDVLPGEMGENITTRDIDLLGLATGTRLRIGADAIVEITGLRNPCGQIEHFKSGLLAAVLGRTESGAPIRKSGVMAIVIDGGRVEAGNAIAVIHHPVVHRALAPV